MKKIISSSILLLVMSMVVKAQIAPGFNFQGVARSVSGDLLKDQSVNVVVGIRSGSESGTLRWEEKHTTSTNEFGLFTLVICGDNSLRTGGSEASLDIIDWGSESHYLDLQLDAGQGLVPLGTSQLLSVPYSMFANSFPTTVSGISVQPESTVPAGEALFMVKREDGYPVFAVYEDGVWVYTDDTGKGRKGGFAVGGYNSVTKANDSKYFFVDPDSTRVYVNSVPGKGLKGGFAVGGYNSVSKQGFDEFLRVTRDSTRVYVNPQPAKGLKGGFAVGGYNSSKAGADESFMSLQRENYFIGHNSGRNITTGVYNSVIGYESGLNITTGESNAFMGYQAGFYNNVGSGNLFLGYQSGFGSAYGNFNTFIGYQTGFKNWGGTNNTFLGSFSGHNNEDGSYNTFVGDSSGYSNISGGFNTLLGTKAGLKNSYGYSNVFVGNNAGIANEIGSENVFIGREGGFSNVNGARNVFIGTESGYRSSTGWDNIIVGTEAGKNLVDGSGNVIVGYQAGSGNQHGHRNVFLGNAAGFNETGEGKLYISNTDADSTGALIWGDFYNDRLRFNANVGIGADPGFTTLLINSETNVGSLSIQGAGNEFDYSSIYLKADGKGKDKFYLTAHKIDNSYLLAYSNGTDLFPKIILDTLGHMSINNWEHGTEVLDVNGNARFRGVGTGLLTYDLGITANGTLTTNTSDARLKSDFESITNGLEKVLKMEGYTYLWRENEGGSRDAGLIAQEVAEIFPEAVFVNPNDGYFGINYSRFPALFVEAFKDQQTLIEDQQEEIESLKSRLDKLERLLLKEE